MWAGAEAILRAAFTHRRTAVQSGHALSKDWTAALTALLWLLVYWPAAQVILTGPTQKQVRKICFKELAHHYARLRARVPEFPMTALTTDELRFSSDCRALGVVTRDTGELVGRFSGFHSPHQLVIVTEAEGVPATTFQQIKGLLTGTHAHLLEIGNPVVPYGDFHQHCTNPRFAYQVIHLSCFSSPNVVAGREVIPGMVTQDFIDEMQRDGGPDYLQDPAYQARVLGEFPQESTRAWIPLAAIRRAVGRTFADDDRIRVAGLDVAGPGKDETVFCVLTGRTMTAQEPFRQMLTPQTVGRAHQWIEEAGVQCLAADVGYDPGTSNFLEYEALPVIKVNFGAKSPDPKYVNMGTYIWARLREAFLRDEIGIVDDPVLVAQLAARRIEPTPKGQRRLESKRTSGQSSPDRADALALAWWARCQTVGTDDADLASATLDVAAQAAFDARRWRTSGVLAPRMTPDADADDDVAGIGRLDAAE